MKYIFVGDIHGKVEQVERALAMDGKVIFVGDFMDSRDRTADEHDQCVYLVLEAIKAGKAESIYGNHELSYLCMFGEGQSVHRCSGWDYDRSLVMKRHEKEIRELFKPFLIINKNLLVTHAGLTKRLWTENNMTIDNMAQTLTEWWPVRRSPMHWIGYHRGGRNPVGGTFWCDFNQEFDEVPDLVQVFGHTAGQGIRQQGNSFCIDTLDREHKFLEMELE